MNRIPLRCSTTTYYSLMVLSSKGCMFSGIIEVSEKPVSLKKERGGITLKLPIPEGWKPGASESVSVDGVCLTVEEVSQNTLTFFYMPESIGKTNIANLSSDHRFNLERALTLNSLLGGHLVSGHIDTVGNIVSVKKEASSVEITVVLPKEFIRYIVYKGSVAINGVSLTVSSVAEDSFTVSLIPHTLKLTNLGELKEGDIVNVEVDLIAKYLEKLIKTSN